MAVSLYLPANVTIILPFFPFILWDACLKIPLLMILFKYSFYLLAFILLVFKALPFL